MKFHNVDIFYKFGYIFDLSSELACRVESINHLAELVCLDRDLVWWGMVEPDIKLRET